MRTDSTHARAAEHALQLDSTLAEADASLGYVLLLDSLAWTRADSAGLTPAQLVEFAGDYRSDEVEMTRTLKVDKEQLVLYANKCLCPILR